MAIRGALAIAAILAVSPGEALAADYTVSISGTAGTVIGGTCLLIVANESSNHAISGSVPLTLQFSGDLISCAIQQKAEGGDLRIVITDAGGRVVAEASKALPFGVLIAAGR